MNYYKRLNSDEKRKIKKEFLASEDKTVYKKSNRIILIASFGILLGIGAGLFDYILKNGIASYIFDISLVVFSVACIIYMYNIKMKEINKFALKEKEKKKKS